MCIAIYVEKFNYSLPHFFFFIIFFPIPGLAIKIVVFRTLWHDLLSLVLGRSLRVQVVHISLFPVVRARRQLARVSNCGAGKALERRRMGIDAEGNSVGVDLVLDESVKPLLDLGDAREIFLPVIIERLCE